MKAIFTIMSAGSSVCSSRSASPVSPCYSRSLPAASHNHNNRLLGCTTTTTTTTDQMHHRHMPDDDDTTPISDIIDINGMGPAIHHSHTVDNCCAPFILYDDAQYGQDDIIKMHAHRHPFKRRYYPSIEWPMKALEQLTLDPATTASDFYQDSDLFSASTNMPTTTTTAAATSDNSAPVSTQRVTDYDDHSEQYDDDDDDDDDDDVFTLSGHQQQGSLFNNIETSNINFDVHSKLYSRSHDNLTSGESHDNDYNYHNCSYDNSNRNNNNAINDNNYNGASNDSDATSNNDRNQTQQQQLSDSSSSSCCSCSSSSSSSSSGKRHRPLPSILAACRQQSPPPMIHPHSTDRHPNGSGSSSFKLNNSNKSSHNCTINSPSLAWLHLQSHLMNGVGTTSNYKLSQPLTLEELKIMRNSCSLCGCNWQYEHLSLDCQECGGYSMKRPCPICNGKCSSIWQRNVQASHEQRKAAWAGACQLTC